MSWWQMSAFVFGAIFIIAFGAASAFLALLKRQEKRDGLR